MQGNEFLRDKDVTWFGPEIGNILTGMMKKACCFLLLCAREWILQEKRKKLEIGNLIGMMKKIRTFCKFYVEGNDFF